MKILFSFLARLLLAMLTSCATQQDYATENSTDSTDTSARSGAIRTAGGGGVSMPSNGPSMMGGSPR